MRAIVDLTLWPTDRAYRLPGTGTRSLLFRFDGHGEQPWFGAVATTEDDTDFEPGRDLRGVALDFWATAEAHAVLADGSRFAVWYGGDIGEGSVRSC